MLPLATLTWKDWKPEPAIAYPRRAQPCPRRSRSRGPGSGPAPARSSAPAPGPGSLEIAVARRVSQTRPTPPSQTRAKPPVPRGACAATSSSASCSRRCTISTSCADSIQGGDFCLHLALEKLPSRVGVVYLYDIDRREFVVVCVLGTVPAGLVGKRFAETAPVLSAAMRKRRAMLLSAEDAAIAEHTTPIGGAQHVLLAPVMQAGRFLGAIELVDPPDASRSPSSTRTRHVHGRAVRRVRRRARHPPRSRALVAAARRADALELRRRNGYILASAWIRRVVTACSGSCSCPPSSSPSSSSRTSLFAPRFNSTSSASSRSSSRRWPSPTSGRIASTSASSPRTTPSSRSPTPRSSPRSRERWVPTAQRETPTVRAILILDDAHDVLAFASRAGGAWGEEEDFRRLLVRRLLSDMELGTQPEGELRHLHREYDGQSYLVSYWQKVTEGHRYIIVAWHDIGRIVKDTLPTLFSESRRRASSTSSTSKAASSTGRRSGAASSPWACASRPRSTTGACRSRPPRARRSRRACRSRKTLELVFVTLSMRRHRRGRRDHSPRGRARAPPQRAQDGFRREREPRAQDAARARAHVRRDAPIGSRGQRREAQGVPRHHRQRERASLEPHRERARLRARRARPRRLRVRRRRRGRWSCRAPRKCSGSAPSAST